MKMDIKEFVGQYFFDGCYDYMVTDNYSIGCGIDRIEVAIAYYDGEKMEYSLTGEKMDITRRDLEKAYRYETGKDIKIVCEE